MLNNRLCRALAGWCVIVLVVFMLQTEKARHGASRGHVHLSIRKR